MALLLHIKILVGMCLNIITREAWQALKPNIFQSSRPACSHVFWMNVKFLQCNSKLHCISLVGNTQRHNIFGQKIRDIRYNFVVGGDGCVYEGRGWTTSPLLPKKFDSLSSKSLLVGFLGFFTIDVLPDNMKAAGDQLTGYGVQSGYVTGDHEFHDLLHTEQPGTTPPEPA